MDRTEFLATLKANYEQGIKLIEAKNQDYATGDDPFANFRMSSLVGVPVEKAILMRVCDKLARATNIWDKPPAVKDEAVEDTLLDACNYLNILLAYRKSKVK